MHGFKGPRHRIAAVSFASAAALGWATAPAQAAVVITGTTGASYLVTGAPVNTTAHDVLKIAFVNNTSGTNLVLCAGTLANFNAGTCATVLSSSGGPGFEFLTVIDAATLNTKVLYVLRDSGSSASSFTLTIE